MPRLTIFAALFAGCGLCFLSEPAAAAGKRKSAAKPDPALGAVEKVLRAEAAGQVDRRGQLAGTLKQQPDSPAARWLAGFVKDRDSWRSFDTPSTVVRDIELLEHYRQRRDEAPQTCAGQVDLANWCRKEGLNDGERAHLAVALSFAAEADQPRLLQRLGYQQVGGQWVSRERLLGWQLLNRRIESAIQNWVPRLEKIAENVDGSQRQHDVAVASLAKLTEPEVMTAIQYVLSGRNEASAAAAVDAFGKAEICEATAALAETAVFSKWPEIRRRATNLLKARRFDDFIPVLIDLLASRIIMSRNAQLFVYLDRPVPNEGGHAQLVLLANFIVARETDDQFQVVRFQATDFRLNQLLQNAIVSVDNGLLVVPLGPRSSLDETLLLDEFGRSDAAEARYREKLVEDGNERTEELNRRIISVLAELSGRAPDPEPAAWWKWWADYSDVQQAGNKPVVVVSEDSEIKGDPSLWLRRCSCFAAGTPVWTETGAQAIETIKVGDRVLAKHIETGELTYKPVLQTTVRPPKELTTLRFGDETIVCTGGHRFWSSGSGWIKARDLTPQTLLHTATGNTPVWSAKKGDTAETYNLVVADFHTYFVGKTGVLCQDLLIPRSTNSVVPGLPRGRAVAQR